MALLAKFASRKLGVVVVTIGVALIPMFVDKITEAIDWRIYAIAGGYVVMNVVQKVWIAYITRNQAGR